MIMTLPLSSRMWRASLAVVLALSTLLVAGCGKVPLFTELTEGEANEMMAVLLQKEIDCTKAAAKDGLWSLSVTQSDFSRAVEVLRANGYPRDKFVKIGDVFQKSGLVSSPTEERIRYMYALSQEIADTLMRIDGVMNARVHIVIPDNDPLAERVTPSSAAVFIRYRTGFDLESLTPHLKNLVTRSIEGLSYDNVSLVLVPAATLAPANGSRALVSTSPDVMVWSLLALLVVGVTATATWAIVRHLNRREMKSEVPA